MHSLTSLWSSQISDLQATSDHRIRHPDSAVSNSPPWRRLTGFALELRAQIFLGFVYFKSLLLVSFFSVNLHFLLVQPTGNDILKVDTR